MSDVLHAYERALGYSLARLADDAELPRELLGLPAWLMPDPNPFPVFKLWRWRR
jgi:hypothetical protein